MSFSSVPMSGLWGEFFFAQPERCEHDTGCGESCSTALPNSSDGSEYDDEMPNLLDTDSDEEICEPCSHNLWDNLRTKREVVSLRCRVCSAQWKAPLSFLRDRKCQNFVKSCPDEHCTKLHIFKYKLPAKTRTKLLKQQQVDALEE
eukprot:TRINITY_DN911_c1_g1_i1.p1 TRINITY_DN911_c1_g1~~TRINITY_DN911_c1_g1_i1.p1  ORF type:complete len:167 (+),score=32.32 TRINITY_DN911_c1_g1_i1:65-502(+)